MRPSALEEDVARQRARSKGVYACISVSSNDLFHCIAQLRHRGVWPEGVGEVFFSCPVVKKMRPLQLTEEGRVRRVRGMAYPNSICH